MGLFDDIKKQGEAAIGKLGSNVQDYIKSNVSAAFVKVGEAPKGNLTAAQIAAGQTGQAEQAAIAAPASGMQMVQNNMMYIIPVVAGLIGLALLMKKR